MVRRENLEHLVTTGVTKGKRSAGKQCEKNVGRTNKVAKCGTMERMTDALNQSDLGSRFEGDNGRLSKAAGQLTD